MKLLDVEYEYDASTNVVLKLEDIHKVYRSASGIEVWALRGIDLEILRGDYIAIMGPSGHGKTTLLNIIGLLDRPTRGKVYLDGVDVTDIDDRTAAYIRNKKIGFVFQTFNLINRMSILENIELPLIVRGIPRNKRIEMVKQALIRVGGDLEWLSKRPTELSGGQQQRVAIARAIVGDPEIILADEPTGNLDTKSAKVVMEVLKKLNEAGKTIIVVTHALEIANCAKRILFIRDGKIIRETFANYGKSIFNIGEGS